MPQQCQHIRRALDHVRSRPVNALHPGIAEVIVILRWDDATCDDLDVAAAFLFEQADQFGDQRLVARSQARRADHIHAAFECQDHRFLRRLEERPADHVKAHIAEC